MATPILHPRLKKYSAQPYGLIFEVRSSANKKAIFGQKEVKLSQGQASTSKLVRIEGPLNAAYCHAPGSENVPGKCSEPQLQPFDGRKSQLLQPVIHSTASRKQK
eukprot:1142038-Pelagomonas_calceolata.AAC.3